MVRSNTKHLQTPSTCLMRCRMTQSLPARLHEQGPVGSSTGRLMVTIPLDDDNAWTEEVEDFADRNLGLIIGARKFRADEQDEGQCLGRDKSLFTTSRSRKRWVAVPMSYNKSWRSVASFQAISTASSLM